MAEAQAQNKLGELFVDLGVGGLGKTLKALNSVSASFLLTKNAATQALSPIVNMSKQGANLVTAFDKINAVTGISIDKLQKMRNWAKLNNVSFEGFEASLENVQQSLMDIRLGKGLNKGYQLLGIEAWQLDPKNPLKALDLIQSKLKQVDEVTGAAALRELGMNKDLLYTFKQANLPISQAIDQTKLTELTQDEIKRLQDQQTAWNKFDVQMENSRGKLIANVDAVSTGLNFLSENIEPLTQKTINGLNWYTEQIAKLGRKIGEIKGYKGGNQVNYSSVQQYEEITGKVNKMLEEEGKKFRNGQPNHSVQSVTGAEPINTPAELPPLPSVVPTASSSIDTKNVNYSPVFNMQFEIMGDGTAEQASAIQNAIITQQELTFSELLNMAGN